MKRIRLFIKGLLFLSFFLPFFVLPTCSNSEKERDLFIRDSLYKDSIMHDSLMKVSLEKSGKLQHYMDSINNGQIVVSSIQTTDNNSKLTTDSLKTTSTNATTSVPVETKSLSDYFTDFLKFLMYPNDETINGFGITIIALTIPFQSGSFELSNIFCIIFCLSFFFTLSVLCVQFFRPCRRTHLYLSIVSLFVLLFLGISINLESALWGYYLALTFNLSDILAIYISLKRKVE
jgi:hypothetical protein